MKYLDFIIHYIIDPIIMITPSIGYIDTCRIMYKTKTSLAYNFKTVLIIFLGQGFKFYYYFYYPYATRIFGQTCSLLIIGIILTIFRYLYKDKSENNYKITKYSKLFNPNSNSNINGFFLSIIFYIILFNIFIKFLSIFILKELIIKFLGILGNLIE